MLPPFSPPTHVLICIPPSVLSSFPPSSPPSLLPPPPSFLSLSLLSLSSSPQTSVTNDRHNCIKDSISQPHSTLYLRPRYMGEVQGMMMTARVTAKAFNGVFMCSFTWVDLVMHLYIIHQTMLIPYSTVMSLRQMVTVCSVEAFSNLYMGVAGPGLCIALLGHTKYVKCRRRKCLHVVSNKIHTA